MTTSELPVHEGEDPSLTARASDAWVGKPPVDSSPLDMASHLRCAQASDDPGAGQVLDTFLARVYEAVRPTVRRRFAGHPEDDDIAQDVTQEVLIRVVTHLHDCAGGTHRQVWAWIYQIARNAGTDYLRGNLSRVAVRSFLQEFERAVDIESWTAWRDALDEQAPSRDQLILRHVFEAYERCPTETAELLWHRIVVSATFAEIGLVYGISAAAAKRRWQRAVRAIRRSVLRKLQGLPTMERDALSSRPKGRTTDEAVRVDAPSSELRHHSRATEDRSA